MYLFFPCLTKSIIANNIARTASIVEYPGVGNNIDIPHITALTIPSGECFFFTYMGFPQFGHLLALSLISFPHSGHLIKAMSNPSSFIFAL